jgi:single-stranded DNA-binding protein
MYTSHWWRDESGKLQEQQEAHQCLFFGRNAEKALRFLQKGTHFHLSGTIHYEKSKKQSPFKGVYTKIIVEEFTVSDRIMLSKEMYEHLFPGEETNRVESCSRERYEMENFDQEVARIENWGKDKVRKAL